MEHPECSVLSSPLSGYLKNNLAPTADDIVKTRILKEDPVTELRSVEELVIEAQRSLELLMKRRESLQITIYRCDTILSPSRRVPDDIWREIFIRCLPSHRNPILSFVEAPLLLTHVCSIWRSISLSTPQIWNRIHIPLFQILRDPIWDIPPPYLDNPDIHDLQFKLQMRSREVREWLRRSGSLPLSITVSNPSGESSISEYHAHLLDSIMEFSGRFRNLELMVMDSHQLYVRCLRLTLSRLPMLRNLAVYSIPKIDTGNSVQWYDKDLFIHPNLRRLSIGYLPLSTPPAIEMFPLPPNWRYLDYLSINSAIPLHWARDILIHCHSLLEISIKINDATASNQMVFGGDQIIIPRLTTFSVFDDCSDASQLYDAMQVPELHALECYGNSRVQFIPTPHFFRLLPRVLGLRKLTINPQVFTKESAVQCFRLAPSITHLSLGRHQDYNVSLLPSHSSSPEVMDILATVYPHDTMLLPNLEILEAYGVMMADKKFLDLMIARFDPTRPSVARLKKVSIRFHRVKQMDVSRQIEYHAKLVGVDIDLDLSYLQRNIQKGLSPAFGLRNQPMYLFST